MWHFSFSTEFIITNYCSYSSGSDCVSKISVFLFSFTAKVQILKSSVQKVIFSIHNARFFPIGCCGWSYLSNILICIQFRIYLIHYSLKLFYLFLIYSIYIYIYIIYIYILYIICFKKNIILFFNNCLMYFCIFIYFCTHTDRETVKFRMYIIMCVFHVNKLCIPSDFHFSCFPFLKPVSSSPSSSNSSSLCSLKIISCDSEQLLNI